MTAPVLDIRGLRTAFAAPGGEIVALDGIDLPVNRGEIAGLAGESGSGKSLTGFAINGLIAPPGRVIGGQVLFDGADLLALPALVMRRVRGRRIAMIFQDR